MNESSSASAAPAAPSITIPFCPHRPWPKQAVFLSLDCKEAFYGGAAAGGKSEALLMGALQYVHVPGYAALILRKDTQRLRLAGGLAHRAGQWLLGSGAKWRELDRTWTIPTLGEPATISFGYLKGRGDRYRYGSSEYQYIAFDELTEFREDDYLFLFSRLRRRKDLAVPLRMRSASNPGNIGHAWVLRRFISPEAFAGGVSKDVHWNGPIAYVPARIADNPAIDEAEYRETLSHLPALERERLMNGDWSVREEGLIRAAWLKRYEVCGARLTILNDDGSAEGSVDERECRRFVTIDPAGTSAERASECGGREPSWSVIAVWDQPYGKRSRYLFLRHVTRQRVGFGGLVRLIQQTYAIWKPIEMLIEGEKLGVAVADVIGHSLPLHTLPTGCRDKVARAGRMLIALERGEMRLPREKHPWLADLESEWLAWTGHPNEVSDQVDVAAYAANVAEEHQQREVQLYR